MKIISAGSIGAFTFVECEHRGAFVRLRRLGDQVSITTGGRGNVRFAKHQAKLIASMIFPPSENGGC